MGQQRDNNTHTGHMARVYIFLSSSATINTVESIVKQADRNEFASWARFYSTRLVITTVTYVPLHALPRPPSQSYSPLTT